MRRPITAKIIRKQRFCTVCFYINDLKVCTQIQTGILSNFGNETNFVNQQCSISFHGVSDHQLFLQKCTSQVESCNLHKLQFGKIKRDIFKGNERQCNCIYTIFCRLCLYHVHVVYMYMYMYGQLFK